MLSATSLAAINQPLGTEPINLVEIEWVYGFKKLYADKNIPSEGIEGRILSLSDLNSVLRIDSSGAAGTLTIVLDDTDEVLKSIYDNVDIHKKPVIIYQWFTNIPLGEKFVIFEGQITSPIIWSEGERTLSFSITTKVEDREVGFAAEEGQFAFLNVDLLGKAWPLAFGTPQFVPAMPLTEFPTAILVTAFGLPDIGLLLQIDRLRAQPVSVGDPPVGSIIDSTASSSEVEQILQQDAQANEQWATAYKQALADRVAEINVLSNTYADQDRWYPRHPLAVNMYRFPSGDFIVKINDTLFSATLQSTGEQTGTMILHVVRGEPGPIPAYNNFTGLAVDGTIGANKEGFQFFNAGSTITIVSPFPMPHVVNCLPSDIIGVYAYRSFNGIKKLVEVPKEYYTIATGIPTDPVPDEVNFDSGLTQGYPNTWFNPTFVILKRPLSVVSYLQDKERVRLDTIIDFILRNASVASRMETTIDWEDQIYVTLQSSVGPNVVDILIWIIETFTTLRIDENSFNIVREQIANYPAHFCLFDRKPVMAMLSEIAYQARCAVWLKENTFYIRYLSIEPDSVDTISEADIQYGSLRLESTDTEQLITKYTATWKKDYSPQSKDNKVILRHNVAKYGIQEGGIDYYIYNVHYSVKKSATYWMIKQSNTWKKVVFKTFLHKLNLETLDCVTLNFADPTVSLGPIKGIVESSIYNSSDNTIEMTVWLPIRVGEMVKYDFAWPGSVEEGDIFPTVRDIQSGGGGNLIQYHPGANPYIGGGSFQQITVAQDDINGFNPNGNSGFINTVGAPDTLGLTHPSDKNDGLIQSTLTTPPRSPEALSVPHWDYGLYDQHPLVRGTSGGGIPGKIKDGKGTSYTVTIYPDGVGKTSKEVKVTQLQIKDDEVIPKDTWVIVTQVGAAYYMQVPIWLV